MSGNIADAAHTLIRQLKAPANWHAVSIHTGVIDGQFYNVLSVQVRPGYESKIRVPADCMGVPVVSVPWTESQAELDEFWADWEAKHGQA